jgi:Bifunctional DNA primase/polymerase, N-terminal
MSPTGGLLDHALAYAARDWPVFPLRPRDKVPLIAKAAGGNGCHDATCDEAQIREWWVRWPTANIGLATGPAFWVLDVDYGGFTSLEHDGLDTLDAIQRRYGRLPPTVRAQTGSGGWHFLFRPDTRIANIVRSLPGLDTRSTGGYIVAPPSLHPNGAHYVWIAAPGEVGLAAAPEWLIALVEPLEEPVPPPRPVRTGDLGRYAAAALEKACERIEQADKGTQADTLDHESYGIGRLVGGGVIPRADATAALVGAGLRMRSATGRRKDGKPYRPWTRREIAWRVDRALAAGARNPRVPETGR